MAGANITVTGMPASVSRRTASIRLPGVAARGSMLRARWRSIVVIEIATRVSLRCAMRLSTSMSRRISADLVMIVKGWLVRSSTSMICRVTRSCFSSG